MANNCLNRLVSGPPSVLNLPLRPLQLHLLRRLVLAEALEARVAQEVIGGPSSTTSDRSGLPLLRGLPGAVRTRDVVARAMRKSLVRGYTATIGIVHF